MSTNKEYQVIKVDPCAGCQNDCATCYPKKCDRTDFRFELPYFRDDYYDAYSRIVNLFIRVGYLCEQCLTLQMETHQEIIRHCERNNCFYYWASRIYITDVEIKTEPFFRVCIKDCYYRFPSYQTVRNMKEVFPTKWARILGLPLIDYGDFY